MKITWGRHLGLISPRVWAHSAMAPILINGNQAADHLNLEDQRENAADWSWDLCRRGSRLRLCRRERRCRSRQLDRIAGLQCLGWAVDHPILRGKACRHLDSVAEIAAQLDRLQH